MELKELKEIEFKIEDFDGQITGDLSLVSLVSDPAMEENFQLFSKHNNDIELLAKVDDELRLVTGPVMIPNKRIKRFNPITKQFYKAWFSESTVRACAELYLKRSNHTSTNFEHGKIKTTNQVSGVFASELWIVEDPECDKAKALGWDVPKGTWMQTFKIDDLAEWEFIKSKVLKGFSLEGIFNHVEQLARLDGDEIAEIEAILNEENRNTDNEAFVLEILRDILNSNFDDDVKKKLMKKILKKINR